MRALYIPLLFLAATSMGQSWCPPGAQWISYPAPGWPLIGYTRVFYNGDTLLGGMQGQKLGEQHAHREWGSTTIHSSLTPVSMITAHEDGVVQVWSMDEQSWDTLFWFSALPGDRWQRPHAEQIPGNPAEWIEVTDTSTVVHDGVALRQLQVIQVCEDWVNWGGPITERFGYYTPFYFPNGCSTESGIWWLRCYSDVEMDVNFWGTCADMLSVQETSAFSSPDIHLAPNPGTDRFTINLPAGAWNIDVLDALGRRMLTTRNNSERLDVDATALAPGTYLVRISGATGNSITRLWTKQ